jgi:hypothetical protein
MLSASRMNRRFCVTRRLVAVACTSVLAIALVAAASTSSARAAANLVAHPSRVDLGQVPVNDPGCVIIGVPGPGCTTAVVLVTNTGDQPVTVGAGSVCERIIGITCATTHKAWGGFTEPPATTCPGQMINPGETCQVTLVALPSHKGKIRGEFIMRDQANNFILIVPVEVRGI